MDDIFTYVKLQSKIRKGDVRKKHFILSLGCFSLAYSLSSFPPCMGELYHYSLEGKTLLKKVEFNKEADSIE